MPLIKWNPNTNFSTGSYTESGQSANNFWLISGNETLLMEQSLHQLTELAKANQFKTVYKFYGNESFAPSELLSACNTRSLFDDKKRIEIHLMSQVKGYADTLYKILEKASPKLFVIIYASAFKNKLSGKWVKLIEDKGYHIQHPILNHKMTNIWLEQRLKQANIQLDQNSKQLLQTATEGNLLALNQEIQLLEHQQQEQFSYQEIRHYLMDSAKFNLFNIPEKTFLGKINVAIRMVRRLRQEDNGSIIPIIWSFNKQLNLLLQFSQVIDLKQNPQDFFKQQRIYYHQRQMLENIVPLGKSFFYQRLHQLLSVDRQFKGQEVGDPWLTLERFIAQFPKH